MLRERPRALQALGVAGVLVGIGLVTAWGAQSECFTNARGDVP